MVTTTKANRTAKTSNELYFGPLGDKRVAAFHLRKKNKNLFLTITDITGSVITAISAKLFASDRKKRFAPHIIELATRQLVLVLRAYRISSVRLIVKVPQKYLIKALFRVLRAHGIGVTLGMLLFISPHNGCRKKKRRRL